MVKKNKSRQMQESPTTQNGGDSAESCDQKKGSSSGGRCTHVQKAIKLPSIKRALKNGCLAGDCPGCIKDGVKIDGEEGVQNTGLWLCLQCGHQGCGRTQNEHALKHYQVARSDPHCLVVNTTSWNVWCYACEVELDSEYRKRLHECVKYLKNLDCPSSVRVSAKSYSAEESKEMETDDIPMPLTDVTNMPHGVRVLKKKMTSLPRVRGLQNLGNTCFFNSVMQCLAQTPHFLEILLDTRQGGTCFSLPGGKGLLPKPETKQKGNEIEEDEEELPPLEGKLLKWGALTETLASVLEELRLDDATAVNPQRLFNKFTTKCPQFGGGDQHDAHELLRHLLDEVRTEDLKRYWMAILDEYGLSRHDTNETVDGDVRARVRAYGRQAGDLLLLPDHVFRGILVSTVECQDCLHSNQRMEPFYDLSLPVTTNKPQPPVMRRKIGGEESFDVCGNMNSEMPSKHQLKKERRQQRKGRKKQQQQPKISRVLDFSNGEPPIAEETHNSAESEQSDADVEDNVEQDVSQKDVKIGELMVNGEVAPLELSLCNGNASENEIVEYSSSKEVEQSVNNSICNGDLITSSRKLCNEIDIENELMNRKREIKENGICDNGEIEETNSTEVSSPKVVSNIEECERGRETEKDKETAKYTTTMKGKTDVKEEQKNQDNSIIEESLALENNSFVEGSPLINTIRDVGLNDIVQNGVGITNGNTEDEITKNREVMKNGVHHRSSIANGDFLVSNSPSFQIMNDCQRKTCPTEELSLSISTTINSPFAMGSPVSNTGSPCSVSSDLNVELHVPNNLHGNNWQVEDTDRPFSRIAFCNDDELVATNNNEVQTTLPTNENTLGDVQKTGCAEGVCKELVSSDQLAKDMAGLSLGHDECQSPSHWDTCSAHSLEDVKDSKHVLPLEIPVCNGVIKCSETEHGDEGDKVGTLAPRYHCGDKECSIESCLNQFTLLELMTGSCKVICENCTERINKGKVGKMVATNSTKQYLVNSPPTVLVLHLKRFEVHQNMFRKTPRHVTFPMLLDIAPICNTKCRELPTIRKGQTKVLYSLYGVVQHSGNLHGGHYSAYVKVRSPVKRDDMRWGFLPTSQSSQRLEELSKGVSVPTEPIPGKWYHVSDSRVNEVNEDRVLHSQAYLLFYERVW